MALTSQTENSECWLCHVEGVGDFLQRQLMAMQDFRALEKGFTWSGATYIARGTSAVDKARATIYSYDSFDKRANQNPQAEVADELIKKSLPKAYQVVAVHSPIQKDGYNCGLFVCLYFWRRLCKEAGNDYSTNGLLRRRWDMLRTMVTFVRRNQKRWGCYGSPSFHRRGFLISEYPWEAFQ
ncbi:Ulp1 protease family, C-terminal catalytic domain [Phytophthora cactorum]|nr:Ulp1 protease family, C-terminal catalytic domain [Phytophthora cactorum]